VRLVGHSLGGVIARGAALRRPELVAQVITLGSPVAGLRAHPLVMAVADSLKDECDRSCLPEMQRTLNPSTEEVNIYSRTDGVVAWASCTRPGVRAIEVRSTHCGLTANRETYAAIAASLAE
jgi:pimeloyl-ACP methyl ester carboxylesterase